jgi:hypothetical protein
MRSLAVIVLAWLCIASLPHGQGDIRAQSAATGVAWKPLATGIEYAAVPLQEARGIGDGLLHVVRIDPRRAAFQPGLASLDGSSRTAGAWADTKGFVAVINAGMYQSDGVSNVGFLRHGRHSNNGHWNTYQSVLAVGSAEARVDANVADAVILDRDAPDFAARSAGYETLVQNLRLIKAPGVNVWQENARRWSEAAIAMDRQGRILFLFTRTPYEMIDFNRRLLALPLEIVRAMHVEGGPEASLSVRAKGLKLDLAGSFETSFRENDGNAVQWVLPNVIGVREKR